MKHFIKISGITFLLAMLCRFDAFALDGAWRGELALGTMNLPLVFNFSQTPDGKTSCTMDSPAQGAKGIPVSVVLCTPDSIAVECSAIGASFGGKISNNSICGKFTQRGYSFPLTLTPDEAIEVRRPQTPRSPFPYNVKDTVFVAPDGVRLSGTLTIPKLKMGETVPAVVMISGSGPQNRDEELFEHRPFAVIADYLARNGVASFRYDDRGTAKSEGDFGSSTTYTFKDDARSAVDFLRSIPGIGKTGVLGHSEGGTIAFMLGAEDGADFIISLAGMAVSGKETLMEQNANSLVLAGVSGEALENSLTLISRIFDEISKQRHAEESLPLDIDSLANDGHLVVPETVMASLRRVNDTRSPWFDTFVTLKPGDFLAKIKCPILAVNGDLDTQVDAAANLAEIKRLCPHAVAKEMPGLNHLLQSAVTGHPSEYGDIRETISPEALSLILSFIARP